MVYILHVHLLRFFLLSAKFAMAVQRQYTISHIPLELLFTIFNFLTPTFTAGTDASSPLDLLTCSLVSQTWHSVAYNLAARLTCHITFLTVAELVRFRDILTEANARGLYWIPGWVEQIIIENLAEKNDTAEIVGQILASLPNLRVISVQDIATPEIITSIAWHCPLAEELNISYTSAEKTFTNEDTTALTTAIFHLTTRCPNLRVLVAHHRNIADASLRSLFLVSTLRVLSLRGCRKLTAQSILGVPDEASGLSYLDVRGCDALSTRWIGLVLQMCKGLRTVVLPTEYRAQMRRLIQDVYGFRERRAQVKEEGTAFWKEGDVVPVAFEL